MKKTLYTILFLLLGSLCNLQAAEFPKISTADNTFWYFIQFANSQNVLTSIRVQRLPTWVSRVSLYPTSLCILI